MSAVGQIYKDLTVFNTPHREQEHAHDIFYCLFFARQISQSLLYVTDAEIEHMQVLLGRDSHLLRSVLRTYRPNVILNKIQEFSPYIGFVDAQKSAPDPWAAIRGLVRLNDPQATLLLFTKQKMVAIHHVSHIAQQEDPENAFTFARYIVFEPRMDLNQVFVVFFDDPRKVEQYIKQCMTVHQLRSCVLSRKRDAPTLDRPVTISSSAESAASASASAEVIVADSLPPSAYQSQASASSTSSSLISSVDSVSSVSSSSFTHDPEAVAAALAAASEALSPPVGSHYPVFPGDAVVRLGESHLEPPSTSVFVDESSKSAEEDSASPSHAVDPDAATPTGFSSFLNQFISGDRPVTATDRLLISHEGVIKKLKAELLAEREYSQELYEEVSRLQATMESLQIDRLGQDAQRLGAQVAAIRSTRKFKDFEERMMCCVCMQRRKDTLLLPCKHLCTCKQCNDTVILAQFGKCPICQAAIESCVDGVLYV